MNFAELVRLCSETYVQLETKYNQLKVEIEDLLSELGGVSERYKQ